MAAHILTIFVLLFALPASAQDAICLNPPGSDQTMWDGRSGTLRYCTPPNVPTSCVVFFDGVKSEECSVGDGDNQVAASTRHECPIPESTDPTAIARFRCANAQGATVELIALATFRDVPLPMPEMPVLLP